MNEKYCLDIKNINLSLLNDDSTLRIKLFNDNDGELVFLLHNLS